MDMDSLNLGLDDSSYWDFLDCTFNDQTTSLDVFLPNSSGSVGNDFSSGGFGSAENNDFPYPQEQERDQEEQARKRARNDECRRPPGSKACREKLRRERLNDRFLDLSLILEPGRPGRTDKPAVLDDAIRVLNQLRTEAQELKETNDKLQEEIKILKAEKNELREEKLVLKADKEKLEQQLKSMPISTSGFVPAHPAAYHAGVNKLAVFPSYGLFSMWQYLPPSSRDTSHDHELRPPAA